MLTWKVDVNDGALVANLLYSETKTFMWSRK